MNRPRIPLASMTVSLWCAVAAAAQTQSASALPETLLVHLKNERLDVVTLSEGCRSVRAALQTLFGSQTGYRRARRRLSGPTSSPLRTW
jgi:hypothetical protein